MTAHHEAQAMIVPKFWAEARIQERTAKKQITVRRWGWSDESQDAAQAHAEERAEAALKSLQAGVKLPRREPKVAYNGADGMPIREEILEVRGQTVLTRNSYGAKCLNTPNVAFVDVDLVFDRSFPTWGCMGLVILVLSLGIAAGSFWKSFAIAMGLVMLIKLFSQQLSLTEARLKPKHFTAARERIARFADSHPNWRLRVYRTFAGFRILVMHRTFSPHDPEMREAFDELQADPRYVSMCQWQNCFRARVSPKPWRIGIVKHIKPRPGVWSVAPERISERQAWLAVYDAKSQGFASCQFECEYGIASIAPEAADVMRWHDAMCCANEDLPLA